MGALEELSWRMRVVNQNVVDLERVFYQEHRDRYLRLDLNENPGGLPQSFIDEVLQGITPEFLSQYPETEEFERSLASFLGVEQMNVCLTNGSSEGIRHVIEAFTAPGGKIVGVAPTYAMYEVYAKMYGRVFSAVPYTDSLEMPVDRIVSAITPDVQLVILLNPNNPIGNVYTEAEMDCIMQAALRNEATVLIDEAYHGFYPNTFLHYALENDNVYVARTFSKLFSLASCRLGCIVGRKEGVWLIRKLCTPHNTNAFALRFAQAIIDHPLVLQELVDGQADGKAYLQGQLDVLGYEYLASEGNFMFLKPHTRADELVRRMKEEKSILVKMYRNIGRLGDCVRVTTAERKYMDAFLEALKELDEPSLQPDRAVMGE